MAATTATSPDDDWEIASHGVPSRIEFDTDGDTFTGYYTGMQEVTNDATGETYDYLGFLGTDGEPYQISASVQLRQIFADVQTGSLAEITRKREIPMGNGRNPMKDYRVRVRREKS